MLDCLLDVVDRVHNFGCFLRAHERGECLLPDVVDLLDVFFFRHLLVHVRIFIADRAQYCKVEVRF